MRQASGRRGVRAAQICSWPLAMLLSCAIVAPVSELAAQGGTVRPDSLASAGRRDTAVTPAQASAPDAGHVSVPMLAGGAFMAAMGGQIIRSPTAWPRTAGGFVRRLGDQGGFVLVEESLRAVTQRVTGWQPDTRPCVIDVIRLVPCAARRVYGARTANGRDRVNLPLVVGIVGGTLTSLAWRPEGRGSSAKARTFVATRLAISVGAPIALRVLRELRGAQRAH